MKLKVQATILAVGILLLVGKFIAYAITGSVGILTDAMESIVNVAAGAMGLWSLWLSSKPKDANHPFGHGKIEMLTASLEGLMIGAAGVLIIYEGVQKIITPQMPQNLDIGILIVAAAGAVNWILGAWSIRVGKKGSSMALVSGGKHLQSDTYSTIGLIVGLTLLYLTDIAWIDGALGLVFGAVIVATGVQILIKTTRGLMDTSDRIDIDRAVGLMREQRHETWIDVHDMRVVSYGESIHLDCHLTLPWWYDIAQGHDQCDALEALLVEGLKPNEAMVSVHADPCDNRLCSYCLVAPCAHRAAAFKERLTLSSESITRDDNARAHFLAMIKPQE